MDERLKAGPQGSVEEAVLSPRDCRPPLTDEFGTAWGEVERPLRAYLASMGASRQQIDDAVQETAARALQCSVVFTGGPDLRRWCFVVARRAWVDELRRERRSIPLDALVDTEDQAETAAMVRVEDRHLIAQVAQALPRLREADRSVLLGAGSDVLNAAERNRRNVARHRARGRLRLLVGPFSAGGVLGLGWARRIGRPVAAAAVPALAALSVAVGATAQPESPPGLRLEAEIRPSSESSGTRTTDSVRPTSALKPRNQSPASSADVNAQQVEGGRPPQPELRVIAPAKTHLSVGRDARADGEALLCLTGDLVDACLDLRAERQQPRAVARDETAPALPIG